MRISKDLHVKRAILTFVIRPGTALRGGEESSLVQARFWPLLWLNRFQNNFEFCICFFPNLCYRVFIPVVESFSEPEVVCVTGLPARIALTSVPSFYLRTIPRPARPPATPAFKSPAARFSGTWLKAKQIQVLSICGIIPLSHAGPMQV
ncbi:hypothetical protein SBA5_1100021 [Candidatus Sulfotelmatomonas gaucii]|uniref:Uncharacterized protein n=1 Tax=Candidatus Sulfuritelmatomonas gaucii TaxID=2043161 RepID=A0A2N9L3P5_9BACT|nr:hypothetical protein SBA5_1100021 [Candidatus Sulfotelmatomonas gaucii]